jgi:hypothetical protein
VTKYATRQRIGVVIFTLGAVATVGWGVGALATLVDLAIGARADTYVPWLVAGGLPLSVAVAGVLLYGGVPELTLRTGCLGVAWGVGLILFLGGIDGLLGGARNVRLGGPAYQAEANDLVRAVIVELVLAAAITAGVAVWRRRWFPTLAAGATITFIIGMVDVIFIGMASAPF